MKIYHKDASLLISKIVHSNKNSFKKLSQTDRKICMAAVKCLSSKQDNGINVNLPDQLSYEKAIINIKDTLDSKTNPKKFFLIQIIISAVKGILNFIHLRISSELLYKNIDLAKKLFFTNHWEQYLKDYCDVKANCELDKAKIFFLGNHHVDYYQNALRQNLITHYANEDQIGENLILLEGLDTNGFPKNLDNKRFTVESWECKEHYEEHGKCAEKLFKLSKKTSLESEKLNKLKINDDISLKDKEDARNKIFDKCEKIETDYNMNKNKSDELKQIRDKDLIAKVKVSLNQDRKIFVIAGNNHLLENGYNVIDSFNDIPCAMIIPKISTLGKQNADKFVQLSTKLGTYNGTYMILKYSN